MSAPPFTRRSLFASTAAVMAQTRRRPNILFLLSDDQRWDALGCMGNPIIRTPHIDRLGGEGVIFRNNFVTTAICMTSRASIFTGLYLRAHGINNFNDPLKPADMARSYPVLMRSAGYRTGFIGKWGVGNAMPDSEFDYFKGFPGQGQYFPKDAGGKHLTNVMGDQAIEFLDGCKDTQPWCLSVSFKAPHAQDEHPDQFLYDPALENLYRDVTIPSPKTAAPEYFDRLPAFLRSPSEGRNRWKKRFETPENYQRMVKAYYRLISGIDLNVGRIRDALNRRGMNRDTVIVYTSDNGMFLAEHGMAGKWLMYEESIRTPMIVYDPRVRRGRRENRSEISLNIDVAPTLLDFAGIPAPLGMQGRSLRPMIDSDPASWRREFFYEHHFDNNGTIPRCEGIRTEQFCYTRYIDSKPLFEELFDVQADPHEERNLAPVAAPPLGSLRKRWKTWADALDQWRRDAAWKDPG